MNSLAGFEASQAAGDLENFCSDAEPMWKPKQAARSLVSASNGYITAALQWRYRLKQAQEKPLPKQVRRKKK